MYKILAMLIISLACSSSYGQGIGEYEVPVAVNKYIEEPRFVGKGRLSKWFWDAYDAYLYSSSGRYNPDDNFALSLDYLMDFSKEQIAKRSIDEIKKQGFRDKNKLKAWYYQLVEVFIDVDEGISITGIYFKDGTAAFYSGDKVLGYINDKQLARLFFDIWLSPKTSEPELRKKLLGIQ